MSEDNTPAPPADVRERMKARLADPEVKQALRDNHAAMKARAAPPAPADVAGLVERLRGWVAGPSATRPLMMDGDVIEAAAALTAQTGEIERLREHIWKQGQDILTLGQMAGRTADAEARAEAAEARIAELERIETEKDETIRFLLQKQTWREFPAPSMERVFLAGVQPRSGRVQSYWWVQEGVTDENGCAWECPGAIRWLPLPDKPKEDCDDAARAALAKGGEP